jgi:hypothetical protein
MSYSAGLCQGREVRFTLDEFYLEAFQANAGTAALQLLQLLTTATEVQDSSLEAGAQSWAVSSP